MELLEMCVGGVSVCVSYPARGDHTSHGGDTGKV